MKNKCRRGEKQPRESRVAKVDGDKKMGSAVQKCTCVCVCVCI